MDLAASLQEIASWSIPDRIRLVQAVLDTIVTDQAPDLTDEQKKEIDQRIADLNASPDNVLTWDQIKGHIQRRQ